MDIAALRNRLEPVLHPFGPSPNREAPEIAVPSITAMLYRLAIVAIGDADSAAVLTADALAQLKRQNTAKAPSLEVAAVRALRDLLPTGWLTWPGAAGPAEWLRLGLRREQADRLLSVLGEREPLERIALALHLLYDVRRDDLDAWLGTRGMGDQLVIMAAYIGEGLGVVPIQPDREECAAVSHDLMDVDEPQLGRRARLHIVGCDTCRARARGFRHTFDLLRQALLVFFRTPLRSDFSTFLRQRERELRRLHVKWRPIAAVAAALLLLMFAQRAARGEPAVFRGAPPAPQNAAELIDRALYRLDAKRPRGEIWHEQIRFASSGEWLLMERWYEFTRSARTRVTVRPESGREPLLDIVSDGAQVSYQVRRRAGSSRSVVVREADVQALMPLLRQLPFAGGLGDELIDQHALDLTLLARARNHDARLLGSTVYGDRPAWMVNVKLPDDRELTLTIDRDTSSLLEARTDAGAADPGGSRRVWAVTRFEVLERGDAPVGTFAIGAGDITASLLNPRQLTFRPSTLINIDDDEILPLLPTPTRLPNDPLLQYVRQPDGGDGIVQVYESRWSTLQLVYPLNVDGSHPAGLAALDRRFDHGTYALIDTRQSNVTLAEAALDDTPESRIALLYWHAFAAPEERESAVRSVLDSLELLDTGASSIAQATAAGAAPAHALRGVTARFVQR